jgi:gamma-glutamylcyclotransferase (GGCT)/AIG2-like uncharacterized protein YtfP
VLDPEAEAVPVLLFECADLPKEWARLDEFEGPDYQRVVVSVVTAEGRRAANIYTLTGR